MHTRSSFARACGVSDEDTAPFLEDVQGLSDTLSLRRPQRRIAGQILAPQISFRPVCFQQLGACPGNRFLPRHESQQLLEQIDQLFVVVGSQVPDLLSNLDRFSIAPILFPLGRFLGIFMSLKPNVGLELVLQTRIGEVARSDRCGLIANIDLRVEPPPRARDVSR